MLTLTIYYEICNYIQQNMVNVKNNFSVVNYALSLYGTFYVILLCILKLFCAYVVTLCITYIIWKANFYGFFSLILHVLFFVLYVL